MAWPSAVSKGSLMRRVEPHVGAMVMQISVDIGCKVKDYKSLVVRKIVQNW